MEAVFNELSAAGSSQEQSTEIETTEQTQQASGETAEVPNQSTQETTDQAVTAGQSTQEKRGPIPLDRHEAVLKNTREEYEAKLQKLAWAEQLNPDEARQKLELVDLLDKSPKQFFQRMRAIAQSDPQLAVELAEEFGFQQQAPAPKAEPEDPMPQPDRLLESGDLFYSPQQQQKLLDWKERQIEKKFTEKFGRFEQIANRIEGQDKWHSALEQQRHVLNDARENWEGFKDSQAEIAALMESDARVTLESAYRRIVVPKLKANEEKLRTDIRQQLIAEMNQRGNRTTGERPGSATPAPVKSFAGMTAEDIVRETYKELAGQA